MDSVSDVFDKFSIFASIILTCRGVFKRKERFYLSDASMRGVENLSTYFHRIPLTKDNEPARTQNPQEWWLALASFPQEYAFMRSCTGCVIASLESPQIGFGLSVLSILLLSLLLPPLSDLFQKCRIWYIHDPAYC